jgi:D-sedoheptulose 7-phosphate isomerase
VIVDSGEGQVKMTSFTESFLAETVAILNMIQPAEVEGMAKALRSIRDRGGRLFILGVGGSAGHAGHAVNDFRKLCDFEAYSPTDNVSELTARINDEGWETSFSAWLTGSRVNDRDGLLVLSVGGGDKERNVSANLVHAIDLAKSRGAMVTGIVGRSGGYTASSAQAVVVIPPKFPDHVTPHTEGLAAVIWHLLVTHPLLKKNPTKW